MKDEELSFLLKKMDVPFYRTHTFNKNTLQWLSKHLGIRNSKHKFYEKAQAEIEFRLSGGHYAN